MNQKLIIRIIAIVMAVLLVLSLIVSVIPTRSYADFDSELAALNSEKEAASQRRISAQNKVAALKEEQAAIIEEKMALEERNEAAAEEIALIQEQITMIKAEIQATVEKIAQKEQDVLAAKACEDEQLEKYRTRIRAMEENGNYNILALLLNSDSFSSLLTAMDDYGDVMASDVKLYDQLQEARHNHQVIEQEYRDYKAECEVKRADLEATEARLEAEKTELESQIRESQALIDEYTEKIKEAEEEQKAMEAAEAAASAAAANFVANFYAQQAAAAAAAAQQQAVTETVLNEATGQYEEVVTYQEVPQQPSGGGGTGSYVWPFPGHTVITSPFGNRASTGSFHTGVDIDGFQSAGSPIVAADGGTVILAEYYGGYGNCIIIDHGNGMSTLYAHLNSMYVSNGSSVGQGSTIGGVGNTGTCYGADGVHLHFEVLVNGSQVDPLGYIGGYPHSFY